MNIAKNLKWYFVDQYMLYGGGGGGGKGGGINPVTTIISVVAVVAAPEFMPLLLPELTAVESAAIVGGVTSAASKAATGGNLEDTLKAGAVGAASGAVGAEVGEAVGGYVGGEQAGPFVDSSGNVIAGPTYEGAGVAGATDSPAAGRIASGTSGGFGSGFTRAELSGQNLQQALRAGEIGAATGFVTSGIGELVRDDLSPSQTKATKSLSGSLLAPTIASLFTPEPTSKQAPKSTRQTVAGGLPTTGTRTVGGGPGGGSYQYVPGVGSAALGQALGVGGVSSGTGSTGGYGAGGEQLSPETGGQQRTVWNIESLRVKPEES